MLRTILKKLGLRKSPDESHALPDLKDLRMNFSVSEAYHAQFLQECRGEVLKIQDLKQQLISRRVRNAIDEVCVAVNKIIGKCQENRDTVSDIRELPAKLRQIHEAVRTFHELSSIEDPADRTRNREVASTLRGIVRFFGTMEQEMLLGKRVSFSAMQEVMSRMVERAERAHTLRVGI